MLRSYWVYIMSGRTKTLYVGVTNNLERRVDEHKSGTVPSFTSKYRLDRLIYFEEYADIRAAIEREKQIKRWRRAKKLALIESMNPQWKDLSLDRGDRGPAEASDKSLRVDPSTTRLKTAASVGMTKRADDKCCGGSRHPARRIEKLRAEEVIN
jgi:putative endonuclease